MTISVAMATYNGEKYIAKQLDSILEQTLMPDEIVVCDDCSKDATLEIVNNYAQYNKRIKWKIIRNETNQGYIKNFYNAITCTTGDIIVLSDQDDVWDKNKLKLFNHWFQNHADMLSIHTDYALIDQNDNVISNREIHYAKELQKYDLEIFCKRLNYCGMSTAFRSSLKSVLFAINPSTIPTHDWTIHALSVVRDGLYVSNVVSSYRRYTGNNVALNINQKVVRKGIPQRLELVDGYLKYYKLLAALGENQITECDKKFLARLIELQIKRMEYLKEKSLTSWLKNIVFINDFPSKKAYLCDSLYLLGIF